MKKVALVILLVCFLLLNACSPAASTPTQAPEVMLAVLEDTDVDILIQELTLDPAEVAIHVGTTVTWFNMDAARHTVTANAGEFESPILLFSDTFSVTFDEPGEYLYSNKYHPDIKGRIVVVP
jgi:plastocyanin